jgi:hypothetical protein
MELKYTKYSGFSSTHAFINKAHPLLPEYFAPTKEIQYLAAGTFVVPIVSQLNMAYTVFGIHL